MPVPYKYNTVVSALNYFASQHADVRRFKASFEEQLDNFATSGNSFPILYAVPVDIRAQQYVSTYTFRIYALDILQKTRDNEEAILTNTEQILNDLFVWLSDDPNNPIDVNNEPILFPVNNYLMDFTAGWYGDFEFTVAKNSEQCMIPFLSAFGLTGDTCSFYEQPHFLTCDTLSGCPTIIGIDNELDNLYSLITGHTYDNYTTGATFNTANGIATFSRTDGGTYQLNLSSLTGGTGTNYWTLSGSNLFNNSGINIGINQSNPQFNLDSSGTTNFEYEDLRGYINTSSPFFGGFASGATWYSTNGAIQPRHYWTGVLNPGKKASALAYIDEAIHNNTNLIFVGEDGSTLLHWDDVTIQNTGKTQILVNESGITLESKTSDANFTHTSWIQPNGVVAMELRSDGLSTDPAPYRVVTADINNILHSALISDILTGSTNVGNLQTVTNNGFSTTNPIYVSGNTFTAINPEDTFSLRIFDSDNSNNLTAAIGTNALGSGFITIYDNSGNTITTIENGDINIVGSYFGDGSQLTGIPDIYTTGVTLNGTILNFNRNDGNTYSVNLSSLTGGTAIDVYTTGGTYNQLTGVATFANNTGGTFNVSGFFTRALDVYTTGGTYNNNTGTLTLNNSTGGTISVAGFNTGSTANLIVSSTTISSGTSGNILFQSGSTLWQNSNLFWDNNNQRLSIRNGNTPGAVVDIRAAGINATDFSLRVRNSGNTANNFLVDGAGRVSIGGNSTGNGLFAFDTGSAGSGYYLGTASAFTSSNAYLQFATGGFKMQFGAVNDGFQFAKNGSPVDNWYFLNLVSGSRQLSIGDTSSNIGQFLFYNNNFGISDGTTLGTGPTRTFWIKNGTPPSAGATDAFQLYSADISAGNAAAHFRTEANDVIRLFKGSAITQNYTIGNTIVSAYTTNTQSSAYAGIDNLQVGSVYSQVSDVNALRVAYENLRVSHDNLLQVVTTLIDIMQSNGLVG